MRQVHSCIAAALQAADGDTRTGPNLRGTQEVQLVYPLHDRLPLLSLRPCPRRPAQALTPGNPSVGRQRDRRLPLLLRQQRPSGARRWPRPLPPASEAWSRAPATNPCRAASPHRTTDMAPMLCHADPCRASPCRPCCLLSGLNRARPRSRTRKFSRCEGCRSGPDSGHAQPRVLVFLRDLPVARRSSRSNPCCSRSARDAPGSSGDASSASFLTLVAPCGATMPNSAR